MNRRNFIKLSALGLIGLSAGGTTYYINRPEFGRLPTGDRRARIEASPNYRDGKFQCPEPIENTVEGSRAGAMLGFLFGKTEKLKPEQPIPSVKVDLKAIDKNEDIVVWLGHSSFYLQLGGYRILMDPVINTYGSPVFFINRAFAGTNPYTVDDFPDIDVLVQSHDHWDHLDYKTVMELKPKVKEIVCPLGVGEYFEMWGFDMGHVHEEDWDTEVKIADDFQIHVLPGQHFSGRFLQQNQTQWAGFAFITPGRRVFFSGDSGYGGHFKKIGDALGPFDMVMLEDGQYNTQWPRIHAMPEQTAQEAVDLRARAMIPAHGGKFALARHAWQEPYERVVAASEGKPYRLVTPTLGEPVRIGAYDVSRNYWWKTIE